jgi:plasmid maintenance system antidote protein VapI
MSLVDELRQAIADSGLTLYRVAKDAGLPYAVVHRFANGTRDITLGNAGKIAEVLGLRLVAAKEIERKKGGKKR